MNTQTSENQGRVDGPWLQFWNDANAASLSTARIAFGQLKLAALTGRFMTQRMRAYAESEGRAESLAQRLDKITEQFGEDYAKQLREVYSSIGQAGASLKSLPTTDTPKALQTDPAHASPRAVKARRSTPVAAGAKSPPAGRALAAKSARQSRERRPNRKRNSSM